MRDLAVQAAGVLAILVAVTHGVLAELRVFARARIEPPRTRRLLRLIWQVGTVDWIGMGVLLVASPWLGSQLARHWVVAVAVVVYACAAIANALATRAVHPGWILMSCVIGLALTGF
jgi:undecaprenyl pyrophosphate phosphatase UppP